MKSILFYQFRGKYRFLSNFYPARIPLLGDTYPSVEHAYQAMKTLNPEERRRFLSPRLSADDAKQMGRLLRVRRDWDRLKEQVMFGLLRKKFHPSINPALGEMLLETGDATLVEGNYCHDQFWGDCTCIAHRKEPGENRLGELLMKVRLELRWKL